MKLYCNAHSCLLLHGSYRVQIIAASGHSARDVFALESASGVDLSPVDQLLGVPLEHVVSVLVQSEFRVGAPDTDVCTVFVFYSNGQIETRVKWSISAC